MSSTSGHRNIICDLYLLCQFFKRDQFKIRAMEFIYFVNLIFIFLVNILFLFLGNMFKFFDNPELLEICATSKEVFHDYGFVLLRFACGFN